MMIGKIVSTALIVLIGLAPAIAFEVELSGGVFSLSGIEPTTNKDGATLTDLDRIEATYTIEVENP